MKHRARFFVFFAVFHALSRINTHLKTADKVYSQVLRSVKKTAIAKAIAVFLAGALGLEPRACDFGGVPSRLIFHYFVWGGD